MTTEWWKQFILNSKLETSYNCAIWSSTMTYQNINSSKGAMISFSTSRYAHPPFIKNSPPPPAPPPDPYYLELESMSYNANIKGELSIMKKKRNNIHFMKLNIFLKRLRPLFWKKECQEQVFVVPEVLAYNAVSKPILLTTFCLVVNIMKVKFLYVSFLYM